MQNSVDDDGGAFSTRSPLATVNGGGRLALKPWNEALTAQISSPPVTFTPSKISLRLGKSQRTPVSTPKPKAHTPSWTTRRVPKEASSKKIPLQLFQSSTESSLRATSLCNLPNATKAEYWLRKSQGHCESGQIKEAISVLKDALNRKVQPVAEISREIARLENEESDAPLRNEAKTEQGVENASQAVEADSDCGTQSNYAAPPISACNAELHRSTNAGRTDEAEAGVTPQKDAPLCSRIKEPGTTSTQAAPQDPKQAAECETPDLKAVHTNVLFDTSPSPGVDVKQEYTPLSKRPPAYRRPSPLRPGVMQTIAASPDPNPALESETAALALEAAVTLSDAGEQTGHATADKPSESPATSEKPAESPEVLSLSAPAQEKTPPSILEDLQPASASELPAPAKEAGEVGNTEGPALATPKSAVRLSSRMPTDVSMLGSPATRLTASRSRVGKHELRALLEGTGNNPAAGEQGSFATLSPMRTPAHLRSTLGPSQVAVTPVRRSARKSMAPSATPSALLQRSGYSFVPNTALEAKFGKDAMVGATDGLGAFKEEEVNEAAAGIKKLDLTVEHD